MAVLQRVLHVDDDESISAITRIALESIGGLQVLSCNSGRVAVEQAAAFSPDLLLIDVMMPDMDGPATLAALAEVVALDGVPVVFMTAKTQPGDHQEYIDLGATAVIVKPFDPMALAGKLESIWTDFHGSQSG
ncbi:response regulator [Modicisalibacter radicis]|uniref:response regulator n=1 Tax=Halomonas sp. EAR18 TaxID=2518972 RepID=UPI00109D448E|nr:response regulator [Halomonas sp. EAR18]